MLLLQKLCRSPYQFKRADNPSGYSRWCHLLHVQVWSGWLVLLCVCVNISSDHLDKQQLFTIYKWGNYFPNVARVVFCQRGLEMVTLLVWTLMRYILILCGIILFLFFMSVDLYFITYSKLSNFLLLQNVLAVVVPFILLYFFRIYIVRRFSPLNVQ